MARISWLRFDFIMLLAALALSTYGVMMIYSASLAGVEPGDSLWRTPHGRQAMYVFVGVVIMLLMGSLDYTLFAPAAKYIYGLSIALLVLVIILGDITYGSRRWLDLGFQQLQPSELAKLACIVALATLFSHGGQNAKSFRVFILSLAIVGLPIGMVFLQPDLGTIAIYVAIWLGIAFAAGVRLLYLTGLGLVTLISIPILYEYLLYDYMRDRVNTFLNPGQDALGKGYNVMQSAISVGSGGLLGKGWTHGTQTQLNFLRIQHTDFIFSVLGEEMGFVGAVVLFALYVVLLLRGLRAAAVARDDFGRTIAVGVVSMILAQAFINIGVNVRLIPVTGVPLPFISYGGSSIMTLFLSLGILQNIVMRLERPRF